MASARKIAIVNDYPIPLPSFQFPGMPVGMVVADTTGVSWQLAASTATVDHTSVEKCAANPNLRWVLFTGGGGGGFPASATALTKDNTGSPSANIPLSGLGGPGLLKFAADGTPSKAVAGTDYLTSCGLTLIQTQNVGADTNTITFGSLSGDTDGIYYWLFDGLAGTGAVIGDFINLRPNGLTTNLHCNGQYTQGWTGATNNVIGSGAGSNAYASLGVAAGNPFSVSGYFFPKTGKNRTYLCDYVQGDATDANNRNGYFRGVWSDTSTAITSLSFVSAHNTFGAGTRASLYKL
jgi:hypothetical protein